MDSFTKKQLLWAGAILAGLFALMLHFFWRDLTWVRVEAKVVSVAEMCRYSHQRPGIRKRYSSDWLFYPPVSRRCDDTGERQRLWADGYKDVRQFWRAVVSYPGADGRIVQNTIDLKSREVPAEPRQTRRDDCWFQRCFPKLKPSAKLMVSHSRWSDQVAEFAPHTHQNRMMWAFIFFAAFGVIFLYFAAGFAPETQEEADMAEDGPYWW